MMSPKINLNGIGGCLLGSIVTGDTGDDGQLSWTLVQFYQGRSAQALTCGGAIVQIMPARFTAW
jgi:hypothetical protein